MPLNKPLNIKRIHRGTPWDQIQRSTTPHIEDFHGHISLTTDVLVLSGIRITQERLGYTKAATIYDEIDLYSTDSNKIVRETLTANGVEILTTETYRTGETDFSA